MPASQSFGSINEENVYNALQKLKIEFDYQVPLGGGRNVRGGQVIDFVLYNIPPRRVALYVQGAYWHDARTKVEDQLKQAEAERRGYRVEEITEEESKTVKSCIQWLQENIV